MEDALGLPGVLDCGAAFDELADSAAVGEWVGEERAGEHDEKSVAAVAG